MRHIKFGISLVALMLLASLYGRVTATKETIVPQQERICVTQTPEPIPTPRLLVETFSAKDHRTLAKLNKAIPMARPKAQKGTLDLIESYEVLTVSITAYCPCVSCCGIWSAQHESRIGTDYVQKTSSGTIPTAGRTIATDPKVIPAGSRVIIDGHEYIAEDTGGGIKGNRIEIYFDTHQEALNWGVQTKEVKVYAPNS